MEETLTIPRRDSFSHVGRSLAVAGMGSLSFAGQAYGALDALLQDDVPSTGSNSAWLVSSLPSWNCQPTAELYARSVQESRSITGEVELARVVRSDRDALLQIKDVLSLTGQQLAAAMGVSRTALYQWLDESVTMREKSRTRLGGLKELSDIWSEKVGGTLARSGRAGGGERSRLVKLLSGKSTRGLNDARSLLESLAKRAAPAPPAHRSVLEIMRERGWKELPEHIQRAEMGSRIPTVKSNPEPD